MEDSIKKLIEKNQMMSRQEYEYIVSIAQNNTMLVFGTGNDTPLWQQISKYAVFLENDPKWIPKNNNQNIYLIQYTSKIENFEEIFNNLKNNNIESLLINLPDQAKNKWDVILVDSPTGYDKNQHGRMQSIYAAYLLADLDTNIIVHDYDRKIERMYSDYLFRYKINSMDRLAHFKK